MEYPVWYIPGLNKGLVIALISVLHVFIAQFAVGGGLYLVWTERKAHRDKNRELLAWLEGHTRFFLLLTMVFGGLSGVGIWFSISVAIPAATALLAHNFLFIWASEWVFFLIEVAALLVYYYTYPLCRQGIMRPAAHMRVGWIYAAAGFTSLFFINGIISFMLTPGDAVQNGELGRAFFNPGYWPSLVYRGALCLLLAGMFALFTAPRIAGEALRRSVVRSASCWVGLPFLVLAASSFWYVLALPPGRREALARRTADMQPFVMAYGWILALIFLAGIAAFALSSRLRRPVAVLILCLGLALVGSFEWMRESGRRPWLVPGHMYSSGMTLAEGMRADAEGVASLSVWSRIVEDGAAALDGKRPFLTRGALLFAQQCAACHGVGGPKLDIVPRVEKLTAPGLAAQLQGQGNGLSYMPPVYGSAADKAALAEYLDGLRRTTR